MAMPQVTASTVLLGVAGLMVLLAALDIVRHDRMTTTARVRLTVALVFGGVVAWLQWP
jgi:uncharacterized membrane protein YjjP (DUF1212 family)